MSAQQKILAAVIFILVFVFLTAVYGLRVPWPWGAPTSATTSPPSVVAEVLEVVPHSHGGTTSTPTAAPAVRHTVRPTAAPTQPAWAAVMKCIAFRESRNIPTARRSDSQTASGLFGFTDGTWHRYKGYAHAWQAPASVQIERFLQVWDGGRGHSNWYWAGHRQCW